MREALAGNMGIAKQGAQCALELSKGRDIEGISALALAGDSAQTTRLADDLAKRFPEDTMVQWNYLPTIHAAAALEGLARPRQFRRSLQLHPTKLGSSSNATSFSLYPVYLRGVAFLAARQGPAAAGEFQRILDHPGLVLNEPIGPQAHLGLGRAYALSGDREKARIADQDFFTLWKDADSDIPVLQASQDRIRKPEVIKGMPIALPTRACSLAEQAATILKYLLDNCLPLPLIVKYLLN